MSFEHRVLGKSGLTVSPIGIGGGTQISSEDLEFAVDAGVNYVFFSSDLHHHRYRASLEGIRRLCSRGRSFRERLVLATVSYVNDPEKLPAVLLDQFEMLGVDYIDVFHWGWLGDLADCESLFASARSVVGPGPHVALMREHLGLRQAAGEIEADLQRKGLIRHLGASFHSRKQAAQWLHGPLDVIMLRYNLAHPGAETEVFPLLTGDTTRDPGIIAFNVAHHGRQYFNCRPPGYPDRLLVPTVPDCYRWALTNPCVTSVLTGVRNRDEVRQALAAMELGPLQPHEMEFMRRYGLVCSGKARVRTGAS